MGKKESAYEKALREMKLPEGWSHQSPYKWKKVDPASQGEKKTLFGLCRACMQGDCSTLVHMEDGIVVKVEGNPDAPPNWGTLCAKGNAEVMALYNPYRIKAPMVRTNPEKGLDVDPKWKEVTWEEALDYTAEKLKEIREKDPRGLVICEGWGQRDTILRKPFGEAFGTPNETGSHGALCTVHYATCLVHAGYPVAIVDLEHCQYHITIGRSLGPNFGAVPGMRRFAKAIERGMKLVVVDPRSSYEASKGEWVPLRPGTALGFLLGMAHAMLHEIKIFDVWFLKNRTNAPYLIDEKGEYVRDSDTNKPMMWDPIENRAKPYNAEFKEIALEGSFRVNGAACSTGFTLVKAEYAKYTPEWAEEISTVAAKTIRRIAREFVEHARIGSTIEIDGFTFPFRPVSLNAERNVTNRRGGTYADLVGKIINMLVGNIEVPGGCLSCSVRGPIMGPTEDGTVERRYEAVPKPFTFPPEHADLKEFYPHSHVSPHLVLNSILHPEKCYIPYKLDAWLNLGANPIKNNAEPQKYVEGFKKLSFVVTIAFHMDEPAIMSDVLLPEHSALERLRAAPFYLQHQSIDDEVNGLKMIQLREPVPTLFNTKNADDIFMDLAERLGILYGEGGLYDRLNNSLDWVDKEDGLNMNGEWKLDLNRRYPLEEIFDRQVRGWPYSGGKGLKELREKGHIDYWKQKKEFYLYYYFPDNQTRHPFYLMGLKEVGDRLRANLEERKISFPMIDDMDYVFDLYRPIPHWVESSESRGFEEGYDLWAINWKTPYLANDSSNLVGNPWLAEIYSKDPWELVILINPATASKKKLKDGDTVVVESRYGKIEGRLRLSELFHPDAVGIGGDYGLGTCQSNPLNRIGPHFNTLLSIDPKTLDAVSAGQDITPAVKVYRKK
ncbi:MAG TPA: molybdopterin-dependent oxidoreductase [Syntrophorhabdaceae bacterium]|nr:molybdopterin-dependent oxidoreductase [Syntrophorhabdaceae bacterium]